MVTHFARTVCVCFADFLQVGGHIYSQYTSMDVCIKQKYINKHEYVIVSCMLKKILDKSSLTSKEKVS